MSTTDALATAPLGTDGPEVGVQGLGCMGMSWAYGPADAYGSGDNETFLSPFFRAHRDEVTIATKFAIQLDPEDPARRIIRNEPAYIRQAVEASLRRLDVDVIDLYY